MKSYLIHGQQGHWRRNEAKQGQSEGRKEDEAVVKG